MTQFQGVISKRFLATLQDAQHLTGTQIDVTIPMNDRCRVAIRRDGDRTIRIEFPSFDQLAKWIDRIVDGKDVRRVG